MNGIGKAIIGLVAAFSLGAGSAQALSLGLTGLPDIDGRTLNSSYSSSTDRFDLTSRDNNVFSGSSSLNMGGGVIHDVSGGDLAGNSCRPLMDSSPLPGFYPIDGACFYFSVGIDDGGVLDNTVKNVLGNANLEIIGVVPALGITSIQTLLLADAVEFGPAGASLEFRLQILGGALASYFGGVGSTVGMIASLTGYTPATGFNDFGATSAVVDVFVEDFGEVPLPGSLALMLVGLLGLVARRHHTQRLNG